MHRRNFKHSLFCSTELRGRGGTALKSHCPGSALWVQAGPGAVGHCPAEELGARWLVSSSIKKLDCRWSVRSQGPASKKTLSPSIREEIIRKEVYMRGRFHLGTAGAEEHVLNSELAEIRGRAVGCTQQPACSERQLLFPFASLRCCRFVYFDCLFPHAQVRREFGPGTASGWHLGVKGSRGGGP